MAAPNPYQDLKDALDELWALVDPNSAEYQAISEAIKALAKVFEQIVELLDALIDLLGELKQALNDLEVSGIPGLEELAEVSDAATAIANAAVILLKDPEQKKAAQEVLDVLSQVSALPSLDEVKQDIIELIDKIVVELGKLKPAKTS